MSVNISDLRMEYQLRTLNESDVNSDPIVQFSRWFDEACAAHVHEPNAMCLATASADAFPSARMVLLKGVDSRGFVFFTDYRSRKGNELAENPHAALCFHWAELERQVRITGAVQRVSRDESIAYFSSRPLPSRIGAWASVQSSVLPSRDTLDNELLSATARFANEETIPLPDHWGGFRIVPQEIEFWQGRPSRLHDRIRFRWTAGSWVTERLSP